MLAPADPLFPAPVPEKISSTNAPQKAEAVNSAAITKSDGADWDLENLDTRAYTRGEKEAAEQGQDYPAFSYPASHRDGEPSEPLSPVNRSFESPLAVAQPDVRAWESHHAVARRNLLLVSSIAVGGLLLASLAFFAFVRSYGKSNPRVANNEPVPGVPKPKDEPELDPGKDNPMPVDKPVVKTPVVETTAAEPTRIPEPKTDVTSLQEPAPSESPLFPKADVVAPPSDTDPKPNGPPQMGTDDSVVEETLPSIFGDFQRLFDAPSRGTWDDVGKADRTIDSEIALENTEVLFREEYYQAAIPIPVWSERSERVLQSVKAQPMPLLQCIDWFSKISDTGITADWLDLQIAGIDWSEPIVIEGQGETVGALLNKICQDRGLEVVVDGDGFPHVRPNQDRMMPLLDPGGVLNIDNTLNLLSQEQRDAWVPLMIRMLDITHASYLQGRVEWNENATVYDNARLSASLRALHEASSQPQAVLSFSRDPFDFVRPAAWWSLKQQLQQTVSLDRIVHEERPVIDLLASAARASGTHLVIDWPAVWQHGLHPSKLSISILRGRTLEEVANRYLEDYALELVVLDSKTVLLTTDAVRRSMEQVVPVRLDRGMSIDDIKGAVRYLVPRGIDQRSRFRWEPVPGNEELALLRICLPALTHLRDNELQKAFGLQ